MSSRAPPCLIITVCSHFKSPLAMYLLHLRRRALFNSEVLLVMSCTCCTWCQPCDVFSDLCYFPSTLSDYIELHCTALRSDYIPHLHSDYIVKRSQVKSCFAASCLHLAFKFSALGFLKLYLWWIFLFVFFFQFVFEIKLHPIEWALMSYWRLQFYGLVALVGCRQLWSVCCPEPETRGVYVAVLKFQLLLMIVFRFVFVPAMLC